MGIVQNRTIPDILSTGSKDSLRNFRMVRDKSREGQRAHMIPGKGMTAFVAGQWGEENSMLGPDNAMSISPLPPVTAAVRIMNSMGCVKILN